MADETPAEKPEQWEQIGKQIASGLIELIPPAQIAKWMSGIAVEAHGIQFANHVDLLETIGVRLGKTLALLEEPVIPLFAGFAAPLVANLFGTEVDPTAFANRRERGRRTQASTGIVDALVRAIEGDAGGPQQPGRAGAKRVASAAVQAAIEGWFNALVPEILESLVPLDILHTDQWGKLAEEVIGALGLGRLVRRVISPLVDVVAAEPMRWDVNKRYRPTLLSGPSAIRQFYRGAWEWADVQEELERHGYSEERISALLNEQQKFFSIADVRELVTRGEWSGERGIREIRDQGYTLDQAELAIRIEGLKRFEQLEGQLAGAAIAAYVSRDIERSDLSDFLAAHIGPPAERQLALLLGDAKRALNIRHLSSAQAAACVRGKILAFVDYRDALAREGYTPDAIDALDLLLRRELDHESSIEKLRAAAAAERAAEKAERQAEYAKRAAELEAADALKRRGSVAELRAAVVRGLIPISRLEEVLAGSYDAETVAVYVAVVEDDRHRYLEQLQRAEDARKRAALAGLSESQLASAVLENVLTLDQYRDGLRRAGLAAADVDVLAATLHARKAAAEAAAAKRRQAEIDAQRRSIDLPRFEQLVLRGHRTIAEYRQLLAGLGYDEGSVAGMMDLLNDRIAEAAAAKQIRDAKIAAAGVKELSLEQLRRAAVLGHSSIEDYQRALVAEKYTADAQAVLLAELRDDIQVAEAARRRREQSGSSGAADGISRSRLLAAARLGIVTPDEYAARLEAAGYSTDDLAIELELLTSEIADVQAARAKRGAAGAAGAARGINLAELARAVKLGVSSIDTYRARAIESGLNAGDVAALVGVLEQELLALRDAKSRRQQIAAELVPQGIALSDLEQSVLSGQMTIAAYERSLGELGYAAEDAAYLGALLSVQLEAASAGAVT